MTVGESAISRGGEVAAGDRAAAPTAPPPTGRRRTPWSVGLIFLIPAAILLGFWVLYPIVYTIFRSFYGKVGSDFVGLKNYKDMFTSGDTLTAIKNNIIWVVFAPAIVTALGLVFAVMTERVRWSTAFKVIVFMPMAISSLSAGVIWRLVYEQDPHIGLANAASQAVVQVFRAPGNYPGARPSEPNLLKTQGKGFVTTKTFSAGDTALLGLVAIPPDELPSDAGTAAQPRATPGGIAGTVWLDFSLGGGGTKGQVDPKERGLPGAKVEALRGTSVAGSAVSDPDGRFAITGLSPGTYTLRLASSNFREPFGGVSWLGPTLITPSIIAAYIWIWAGFAVVVIGAGLAAIPRDVMEASRVDGATEWQVFRRVTVPLLAPVLGVVFVTLIINVLKIFDLVLVIAPGSSQDDANVIALQMWRTAFGGQNNQGLGSALALFLTVLVIPAMLFNIRRFRRES